MGRARVLTFGAIVVTLRVVTNYSGVKRVYTTMLDLISALSFDTVFQPTLRPKCDYSKFLIKGPFSQTTARLPISVHISVSSRSLPAHTFYAPLFWSYISYQNCAKFSLTKLKFSRSNKCKIGHLIATSRFTSHRSFLFLDLFSKNR